MMQKLWKSLSGRLILCVLIALFTMAFLTIRTFYVWQSTAKNQIFEAFESISTEMEERLQNGFEEYEHVARTVGYSTAVQNYLLSDSPTTVIQNSSLANEQINNTVQTGSGDHYIFLLSDNGRLLYNSNAYLEPFSEMLKEYHFDESVTFRTPFFSRVFYRNNDPRNPCVFYFIPVYSTLLSGYSENNRILCAVLCDLSGMTEWMRALGYDGSVNLLLYHDTVLSSSRSLTTHESAALSNIQNGRGEIYINRVKYLTNQVTTADSWRFIYIIPDRSIATDARSMRNSSILLMISASAIMMLLITMVVQSINKNVRQITDDVHHLKSAPNFHIRIPKMIELREISYAINDMVDQTINATRREQEAQQRLYEATIAQHKAELLEFRSQINPHFLFNTLECIRSMAHRSHMEPMENLVSSMALMFRYSSYAGMIVPLEDEIEHLKNYFTVMDIRQPGRYHLLFDVDPQTLSWPVLSMILQPLVENALLHAFPVSQHRCFISVRVFWGPKENLIVRIADNGIGISDLDIDKLYANMRKPEDPIDQSQSSIGLQNIFRRMKLTFGSHFHFRIYSKPGMFTVFELHIPNHNIFEDRPN
jgi:two-component system sensor histidine kinase YesM